MQNIYGYNSMIPLVSNFPNSCTADCTNGEEGCCEEQWRACKPYPEGNCKKNCRPDLKCNNIKGCKTQEETGNCVASSSPSPSPSGGGCYIYTGECVNVSPDSCDNPINKDLCSNDNCYNGLEQCREANHHSPPSPPPPSPHHHLPIKPNTRWPDAIDYIKSELSKSLNSLPKNKISSVSNCIINKAKQNNISPYNFIHNDPRMKDIGNECLKSVGGNSPPSPPSPSGFLSSTTGKIIVIAIIILVLLGLIWLTYVVTKHKK